MIRLRRPGLIDLRRVLLFAFVALGPLGNLLTPQLFSHSFRTYYLLLPAFPLFFICIQEKLAKIALLFIPFLLYCLLSVSYLDLTGPYTELFAVRFFLFCCQLFFMIGAASVIKSQEEIFRLLSIYLKSYFISLIVGYVFFAGYYLNIVPYSIIEKFSVLTQFGWGVMRFSPGSYPNEYGIVSSFVLSVLVVIFLENKFDLISKKWGAIFFPLTCIALLLSTTRAAYLAFFFTLIYLILKKPRHFLKIFKVLLAFGAATSTLQFFGIKIFKILRLGLLQKIDEGSLGARYLAWKRLILQAPDYFFWGKGFGSQSDIHNVYLQLFAELGIFGVILLSATLFVCWIENRNPSKPQKSLFMRELRTIGLIHVLWFAFSNHNFNHHLSWFIFLLYTPLVIQKGSLPHWTSAKTQKL